MTKLHLPSRFSPGAAPRVVEPHEHFVQLPTRLWKVLLAGGALTWIVSAMVTAITHDTILVPTVIVVGSFMIPVTMVAFALSRGRAGYLTTEEVILGFFGAGTFAVASSALLETYVLPDARGTFIAVGLIEELGKGAVLLAVAHQVHHREPRDGMVLGAIVGAGFAAFEAFRALLAPFGHITWTALLGGALFASSVGDRFRLTRRLLLTLLGVVILHAVWDQTYGWAVMLTKALVLHDGWQLLWPNAQAWGIVPTGGAMVWFNVFENALLAINGLIGASWLVHRWRTYPARTRALAAVSQA